MVLGPTFVKNANNDRNTFLNIKIGFKKSGNHAKVPKLREKWLFLTCSVS